MILFCGIASEPPLALAIQAAERLSVEHVVFQQRETDFCDIMVECRGRRLTGRLRMREREWALEEFTGVYTRMVECESLPQYRPNARDALDPVRIPKAVFFHHVLNEWLELADCRVVNRACDMASNMSKPYQAQLISPLFPTPPTLVTNEPGEALAFIRRHGRVIYKSVSSVRSIVREWRPADERSLGKIRALPTQFQAYVEGTNIRVHVVGEKVFATEIDSAAVDYRYAQRDGIETVMQPAELPPGVLARCRELSHLLRLPFCGIDLKRTQAGDYYCFEVNPSPAYSYYQEHTQQPIADALVEYLAAAPASPGR